VRVASGKIDLRLGTSYSAALTAGVAGRLLAERPKLTALEAMSLLRNTSRGQPGGRKVINLAAALAQSGGGQGAADKGRASND
jgi:hypothetical protein